MSILTIDGGIFNFITLDYTPPTWSGGVYDFSPIVPDTVCYDVWVESNSGQWAEHDWIQWNECFLGILNQLWTHGNYVFAAIDFGLDVIDVSLETKVAYVEYRGGFNTVWANDDYVFLGTTKSGIKYLPMSTVSGSTLTPYNLTTHMLEWALEPELTNNHVRYIHGNSDRFFCSTAGGVDFYKIGSEPYYDHYVTVSGYPYKCFMTSYRTGYYIFQGPDSDELRRTGTYISDIDETYTFIVSLTDLSVTEGTAVGGGNTIFLATTSGVYVIDEDVQITDIYCKATTVVVSGTNFTADILSGQQDSFAFTSVWADTNASRTSGKMYVATNDAFMVIKLDDGSINDYYSYEIQTLDQEDIVDINVSLGV